MPNHYRVAYNEAGQYISVLTQPLLYPAPDVVNEDYLVVSGADLDACIEHMRVRVKYLRKLLRPAPPSGEIPVVHLEPKGLPSDR